MTVKTQGGKVVTKDGKVSCSCCVECCMYLLGDFEEGKITQYDLPDEIFLEEAGAEFLLPRVEEYPSSIRDLNVNYELIGIANPYPNSEQDPFINVYIGNEFSLSSGWLSAFDGIEAGGSVRCFGYKSIGISAPGDFFTIRAVYDNFSSSYSVTGPVSGVVTRPQKWSKTDQEYVDEFFEYFNGGSVGPPPTEPQTICRWAGSGIVLKWNTSTARWNVNGFEKSGLQNTPVGSYAGGYSVS